MGLNIKFSIFVRKKQWLLNQLMASLDGKDNDK